ncbi:hypothetical protein HC931_26895 [Candidatus Gracilibacteria bacterium]|nr:hypothetical protein [Candidatus Gracilibacteria bacterium]NJM90339.1 hypothetical protein [Hydrococcus sp. RU_2_2]NJP22221.1 hypothetical protein [Hydrococcus sp. CRU_1_1]NJQ98946.1 hypothetical protein [Hydrococcus sp. CSU_1_8]
MKEEIAKRDRIIAELEKQNARLKEKIRNAKDISPIERISFARVRRLAREACMEIARQGKQFILSMGKTTRAFRKLRQIWDLLIEDDWYLSDIFPQLDPDRKEEKPTGTPCKYCFERILWVPSDWGSWFPIDADTHKRHRCQQYSERGYYAS